MTMKWLIVLIVTFIVIELLFGPFISQFLGYSQFSNKAQAYRVEMIPALSMRQHDGEDLEYGFGFQSHWTFYNGKTGYLVNLFMRGEWTA